jgi:hypothetical protein
MPNEFEGFRSDPVGALNESGVTEWALAKASLELLIHINARLTEITERLTLMSQATDALVSAVTDLSNALNDDTTAITTAVADLKAAQGSGDDAAVTAATANIEAAVSSLKANTAALNSAVPATGDQSAPTPADPNAPAS